MTCSLLLDHVTYKTIIFGIVITPPQIKNLQEPDWQMNHKTAHIDKLKVLIKL